MCGIALREVKKPCAALAEDDLHEAVGRLYYACFYLVSSLLLLEGHTSSKHKGIWTLFDLHCIRTERFPREMGRFLHRLYRRRQDADYSDQVQFEHDEVKDWFEESRLFCVRLRDEIEKGLAGTDNSG